MAAEDFTIRNARDTELVVYANDIAAAIRPTAAHYDRTGEFPFEHFEILKRKGALGLTVPKEYGGQGLSLYETLLVQERIAGASGATALALGWHLMTFFGLNTTRAWDQAVFERVCRDAVERGELINVFATERDAGNVVRGFKPTTVARRHGDGYVISGRKAFSTLAPAVNHFTVLAHIEDDDQTAEFLVQKSERVRIIDTWDALGMRSTGSHDVELDAVEVPADALLVRLEKGKPSRFMACSSAYSLQLPAIYLGIAVAARDFILDFADSRFAPSLGGVILDAPQVQHKIGEIEILVGTSKALLYGLAERWDRHDALKDRLGSEVAITKYAVTNNAIRIVELAMQIAGGHALSRDLPLERYFRDVQCGLYNPPHNDMVIDRVAKEAIARQRADTAPGAAIRRPSNPQDPDPTAAPSTPRISEAVA